MLHLFGDSITYGVGASSTGKSYAKLLATALGVAHSNAAVSGSMVPDQATYVYASSLMASDIATIALGTNDERIYGTNTSKQAYYKSGLSALVAYLAATPIKAVSAGTYSGTWGNTVAYGIGKNSYTNGSKLTFQVSGTVIYLGAIRQAGNGGQFSVKIDGDLKGAFSNNGDGVNTNLGASYGPMLLRFSGLVDALHTVEIEVTSATSSNNRVYIDWWGSNASAKTPVYLANVPYAISYSSGGSSANVDLYNGEVAAIVAELGGDGLPVHLVNINSALSPPDMYDAYHPNDSGHQKICNKFLDVMGLAPSVTYTEMNIYLGSDNNWYVGDGSNKIQITVP